MKKEKRKEELKFLTIMLLFGLIMVGRVFDHSMEFHYVPMGIMQDYTFNQLALLGLLVVQVIFFGICLSRCAKEQKQNIKYMSVFLSVFTFPMFASRVYWGSFDMYVWILLFLSAGLILWNHAEWMSVPLCFVMTCISPMSLFGSICLIEAVFMQKYIFTKQKRYPVYMLGCAGSALLGEAVVHVCYRFYSDAQVAISWEQWIRILILCIPYYLVAAYYYKEQLKGSHKIKTVVTFLLGLPGVVSQVIVGDYGKAVFYGFTYYIMLTLCAIVLGDEESRDALEETKTKIASLIGLPVLVIAYPLLFMLLWIAGPLPLFEEVFVGLK